MPDTAPVSPTTRIRFAQPADTEAVFRLILALADYEQLLPEVTGSAAALAKHLFGENPCIEALVAESDGKAIGFALFFTSYSTVLMQPSLYLEDLFVLPTYRGQGIGKALFAHLAKLAQARGVRRLEWSVLDWNEPAIGFYRRIGAILLDDVRICRLTGTALSTLTIQLPPAVGLRPADVEDAEALFALIRANIEFDGSSAAFAGSSEALAAHLFDQGWLEAIVAEQNQQIVGIAVTYTTYSTFLTQPGLFIEDLFVLPAYRGRGIGKSMLAYLARQVMQQNYGRLEWHVQTSNERAIAFYEQIGATVLPDWRVCRIESCTVERLTTQE
jgi:ribosomal protein S18 acetylase RimI-like enzyme